MDSDDQMDPAYLLPLIKPILLGEADYTKGNRFLHAIELKSMPLLRRIGNTGLSFLTKAASGYWNIFDPIEWLYCPPFCSDSASQQGKNRPALFLRDQHAG